MVDWNSLLNGLNAATLGSFGRDIVYAPRLGQQFTVRAIFEATHASEDIAPGVYAAVFVHGSDLPVPPQRGDAIIVDGTPYKLFDIEADHGGGMILRLRQS